MRKRPINMLLVLVLAAFLMAGQVEVRASVSLPPGAGAYEVYNITSFTVTDFGSDGIKFGNLNPGATGSADNGGSVGAVTISVGATGTFNVNVKGGDFSDGNGHSITIGNVKYNTSDNYATAVALTNSYVFWYSGDTSNTSQGYFWISIPPGQHAGTYNSVFYFQAVEHAG